MRKAAIHPQSGLIGRIATLLEKLIYPVVKILFYIGIVAIMAMMLMVVVSVLMRYVVNKPIFGIDEMIGYVLIVIVAFILPYVMSLRGHIAIDILTVHLSPQNRNKLQVIVYIICLICVGLLDWWCFVRSVKFWQTGQSGMLLNIPFSPFMFILSFGFALFFLVLLTQLLHSLDGNTREVKNGAS